MRVAAVLLAACLVAVAVAPSPDAAKPEDLSTEKDPEMAQASSLDPDEPSQKTGSKDADETLRILRALRIKAEEQREEKGPESQEDEDPYAAIWFWATGGSTGATGATGAATGPEEDNEEEKMDIPSGTGATGLPTGGAPAMTATGGATGANGKKPFPDEKDLSDLNPAIMQDDKWEGKIVGMIGIRGISAAAWKKSKKLSKALKVAVCEVAKIDPSQLHFTGAGEPGGGGGGGGGSTSRRLLSVEEPAQQFSIGYTLSLMKDDDAEAILKLLDKGIPGRKFEKRYRDAVARLDPDSEVLNIPTGAISFVITGRKVEVPLDIPNPSLAEGDGLWGTVGLDDWEQRESGTVRFHNEVSVSIKLQVEGTKYDQSGSWTDLFKAATVLSMQKALGLDLSKTLDVTLKNDNPDIPDWGGAQPLGITDVIDLGVKVRDVPSTFDEAKLNGALTKIVRSNILLRQLCGMRGEPWCTTAKLKLEDLQPSPPPVDDLREPDRKSLGGIDNVLAPYFAGDGPNGSPDDAADPTWSQNDRPTGD